MIEITKPRSLPLTDETWEKLRKEKEDYRTWEEYIINLIERV